MVFVIGRFCLKLGIWKDCVGTCDNFCLKDSTHTEPIFLTGKFLGRQQDRSVEGVKNCNIYMCFNKMFIRYCKICVIL